MQLLLPLFTSHPQMDERHTRQVGVFQTITSFTTSALILNHLSPDRHTSIMVPKSAYKIWALDHYRSTYCDAAGQLTRPFRLHRFQVELEAEQPPNDTAFEQVCDE